MDYPLAQKDQPRSPRKPSRLVLHALIATAIVMFGGFMGAGIFTGYANHHLGTGRHILVRENAGILWHWGLMPTGLFILFWGLFAFMDKANEAMSEKNVFLRD
jgi:hypothetical protein